MLPQHLVCKYELNCEYNIGKNKAPWWWSDKIENCRSVLKCFIWNYMCFLWLIHWSDTTKMHGATIRFTDVVVSCDTLVSVQQNTYCYFPEDSNCNIGVCIRILLISKFVVAFTTCSLAQTSDAIWTSLSALKCPVLIHCNVNIFIRIVNKPDWFLDWFSWRHTQLRVSM